MIFSKQVKGNYVCLSNCKTILNIPLAAMNDELLIEKKRVRMYNTVQIKAEGTSNIKTRLKNGTIVSAKQNIVLSFSKSFVIRKTTGYLLVV